MTVPVEKVRDDFDRIARLARDEREYPGNYDAFLLTQIPGAARRVLDVGCGTGTFTRALAGRGHDVTGIDLSAEMIRVAEERTRPGQRVTYRCGDFFDMTFDAAGYDCVVSLATVHHFPIDDVMPRLLPLVRPGGLLVVHDLRADGGVADRLRSVLASGATLLQRLRRGQLRMPPDVRAAWADHGRDEHYPTMQEVRAWSARYVPGATLFRHLLWRYTVVWSKPWA